MGRTTALHQAVRLRRQARASRLPELDRLKEEIALLKVWLSVAAVIVMSLAGWLISAADTAAPLTFGLAIAGVVFMGMGTLILYRQIGRRIDRIGEP